MSFGVVYISLWALFINNSETDDLYLASVRPREGSTVEADCILGLYPHDQQSWTNKKKKQKNTKLKLCFRLFGSKVSHSDIAGSWSKREGAPSEKDTKRAHA